MTHDPNRNLSFGAALEALKEGKRIAREGWNGKSMFIYMMKGNFDGPELGFSQGEQPYPNNGSTLSGVKITLFDAGAAGTVRRMPHINMRAAGGEIVTGWLASQTDMLASDWTILPD